MNRRTFTKVPVLLPFFRANQGLKGKPATEEGVLRGFGLTLQEFNQMYGYPDLIQPWVRPGMFESFYTFEEFWVAHLITEDMLVQPIVYLKVESSQVHTIETFLGFVLKFLPSDAEKTESYTSETQFGTNFYTFYFSLVLAQTLATNPIYTNYGKLTVACHAQAENREGFYYAEVDVDFAPR